MRLFLPLLAALPLLGCGCMPDNIKPPGDEAMGTWAFHTKGTFAACSLPNLSSAYDFDGTFSRYRDGGRVFFSVQGVQFDAGFDGQFGSFSHTDARTFELADGGNCDKCSMKVTQLGTVALLSSSQSQAVGQSCPPNPLDGGLPLDAGISRPGTTDAGFDAVLACGELLVNIAGEGFCDPACYSCKLQYRLTGERVK